MGQYDYKALDNEGQELEGIIEAASREEAREQLKEEDFHVYELKQQGKQESGVSLNLFNRNTAVIISFTDQLANLLEAGIQLGEALQIIEKLLDPGEFRQVVAAIYESIKSGQGFAEALAEHPSYFSSSYVSMVRAGEEGGFLPLTCRRLAKNLENRKELTSFIITSLIYPIILVVVTILAVVVMLTYVLPKFVTIYENYGGSLPLVTKVLLTASDLLAAYGIYILLFLVLTAAVGWLYYRTDKGRQQIDSLLLRLPLLGELLKLVIVAKVTRNLSTMLESGVPLLEAMEFSRNLTENIVVKDALAAAGNQVKKGGSLAEALEQQTIFPEAAVYMMGIGERTGNLDSMLLEIADNFEGDYRNKLERLMKIFEPVLILVMGLVIGVIVIAMLLPILKINTISF